MVSDAGRLSIAEGRAQVMSSRWAAPGVLHSRTYGSASISLGTTFDDQCRMWLGGARDGPAPRSSIACEGMINMNRQTISALFVTGAMLASGSVASAQRERDDALPRQGACFYEHADYRGQRFC